MNEFVYATRAHSPDLILTDAGATLRSVTGHLGTVRLVVDVATGQVVQRLAYDPWGIVLDDTAPGLQPFGYAGGIGDADTGLVRFGARDYDPGKGRWAARDPLRFGGGDSNLFTYAKGNPLRWIDPAGTDIKLAGGAAGDLVGHRKLCVVPKDPTRLAQCYSFKSSPDPLAGLRGSRPSWLALARGIHQGVVYEDDNAMGEILQSLDTTAAQDEVALKFLDNMRGERGLYMLGVHSCREWADNRFDDLVTRLQP